MASSKERGAVRLAHLADLHVGPQKGAREGAIAALRRAVEAGADAILLGGDTVMNSVSADLARVEAQWALWREARETISNLPLFPCLGNQDVWGWNQKASGCSGAEPLFGKATFLREMGVPRAYYATRLRSWRLIVLDSVQRGGAHGFFAALDAAQRAWLEKELADDRETPTLVLSHVPLVPGPAEFAAADIHAPERNGAWTLGGHLVHTDSQELVALFAQAPNVRLCLAGHTHLPQRIAFRGIEYVVSPPVSGAWWRGDYQGEPRGFSLVDLAPDGGYRVERVSL